MRCLGRWLLIATHRTHVTLIVIVITGAISYAVTPDEVQPVVGNYRWFNGVIITLTSDGKLLATNGASGTWKKENNGQYVLTWYFQNEIYIDTVTLSPDGSTLTGNNQLGTNIWGVKIEVAQP